MDIGRNGRTCSLCLTLYILPRIYTYEVVPICNSISLYFLHYPGLLLSFYHYIFVILMSSTPIYPKRLEYESMYFTSQSIFHFVYAVCFFYNWNVVNRDLYWSHLKSVWLPLALAIHGYLVLGFQIHPYIIGPILSFYMGVYWKYHITVLESVNEELLRLETV